MSLNIYIYICYVAISFLRKPLNFCLQVRSLQDTLPQRCLQILRQRDAELAQLPEGEMDDKLNQIMEDMQKKLRPIKTDSVDASLEWLGFNVLVGYRMIPSLIMNIYIYSLPNDLIFNFVDYI